MPPNRNPNTPNFVDVKHCTLPRVHVQGNRTSKPHTSPMIFSDVVRKTLGRQGSPSRSDVGWKKLPEECEQVDDVQQYNVPLLAAVQDCAKKDFYFAPRRSQRVGTRNCLPDGDTWVEVVVVTNRRVKNGKKRYRSLFYSINTRKAQWDEPPSG